MALSTNDLLVIRAAIATRLRAQSGFSGITVQEITSGDVASRVALLKKQSTIVVSIPEPRLQPGESAQEWLAEFEVFIDECVAVNRRSGSSYRRGEDLEIDVLNALFDPGNQFQPIATASEAIFDGSDKAEADYSLGGAQTRVTHRAIGGHVTFSLKRSR